MCSDTVQEVTPLDGLRLGPKRLTRQVRMLVSWRTCVEKRIWLDPEMEAAEVVEELVQCGDGRRASTIHGILLSGEAKKGSDSAGEAGGGKLLS